MVSNSSRLFQRKIVWINEKSWLWFTEEEGILFIDDDDAGSGNWQWLFQGQDDDKVLSPKEKKTLQNGEEVDQF